MEDVIYKNIFFSELDNIKTSWQCFKDKPDRQIYSRKEEGLGLVSVFYRFKLEKNLFHPFSLLSEFDLLKHVVPDIIKAEILKNHSNFRRVMYMQKGMPFPIDNRDVVVCSTALVE